MAAQKVRNLVLNFHTEPTISSEGGNSSAQLVLMLPILKRAKVKLLTQAVFKLKT